MEAIVVIPANTMADVRNAFYKEYKLRGYKAEEGDNGNREFLIVFYDNEHERYFTDDPEYYELRAHPKAIVYGACDPTLLMMERLKPWKN